MRGKTHVMSWTFKVCTQAILCVLKRFRTSFGVMVCSAGGIVIPPAGRGGVRFKGGAAVVDPFARVVGVDEGETEVVVAAAVALLGAASAAAAATAVETGVGASTAALIGPEVAEAGTASTAVSRDD